MIFNFDSIPLLFLVVAMVTLTVVVVLVWYVYSSKKFRKEMIELMETNLKEYLKQQKTEQTQAKAEQVKAEGQQPDVWKPDE